MGLYGGLGPMTNAVLWVEAVIAAIFVGMRLYTRVWILNSVGADDYLILLSLVLTVIYNIFVHIATGYGLGQLFADVGDPVIYFTAVKYEVFSQVAGLMAIGVGKLSVGAFLLRIVRNRIQVAFIWVFLAATLFITLFASVTIVVQCTPVERSWDKTVPGTCWLDFSKVGFTVGSWFVVADFAFAILPWFVIWGLNMKRKEKITIACGLSLGVFAGACGIVRTVALGGLNAQEYIYDTVPMLIWSATESLVTIMCASIPVLRSLYVHVKYGSKGESSSGGNSHYKMQKYGGSGRYGNGSRYGVDSAATVEPKNTSHQPTVTAYDANNASDESILRAAKDQNKAGTGIHRTDEVSISYEAYSRQD